MESSNSSSMDSRGTVDYARTPEELPQGLSMPRQFSIVKDEVLEFFNPDRIPDDISNEVIDWVSVNSEQAGPFPACYTTLRSCALVCRGWRYHSQYHLFRHPKIFLSQATPNPLHILARRVLQDPALDALVSALSIGSIRPDKHIPIGSAIGPRGWSRSLTHWQTVELTLVDWSSPRIHGPAVTMYLPDKISSLTLYNNVFNTASDLFRLVWSLPLLSHLNLSHVTIKRHISEREHKKLCPPLPSNVCPNLKFLDIEVRKYRS